MIRASSISRSRGRGGLAKGQNRACCELCADGRPVQGYSALFNFRFSQRVSCAMGAAKQKDVRTLPARTVLRSCRSKARGDPACYDCKPILGGGDDAVTHTHETLLSTVRGPSRCKARLREASMPSLNSQRQSNRV